MSSVPLRAGPRLGLRPTSTTDLDVVTGMVKSSMPTFVLFSHDGYGLGHARRNTLVARALIARNPSARVLLVTGSAVRPRWLNDPRFHVVFVPSLVKDSEGVYRNTEATFDETLARRADLFEQVIAETRPDVVLVDRHPFGIAGELRPGLALARAGGSRVLLGLRDVLDEPATVSAELSGDGWRGAEDVYSDALVYGAPTLCDHEREYGIPLPISYCGWVTSATRARPVDPRLLVVTAGGAGDGDDVFRLGMEILHARPEHRALVIAGPYARRGTVLDGHRLGRRVRLREAPDGCADVFASAGAVVQMGGYNTTFEALAAGARPIIVPRRYPRREQVIRASRLSALGLADVVDAGATGHEVEWLLDQARRLAPGALRRVGISLDGARLAARRLLVAAQPRVA